MHKEFLSQGYGAKIYLQLCAQALFFFQIYKQEK